MLDSVNLSRAAVVRSRCKRGIVTIDRGGVAAFNLSRRTIDRNSNVVSSFSIQCINFSSWNRYNAEKAGRIVEDRGESDREREREREKTSSNLVVRSYPGSNTTTTESATFPAALNLHFHEFHTNLRAPIISRGVFDRLRIRDIPIYTSGVRTRREERERERERRASR